MDTLATLSTTFAAMWKSGLGRPPVFRQNTNCYGRDAADTDTLCSIFGSKATLITGLMEGRNDEVAGLPAEQESGLKGTLDCGMKLLVQPVGDQAARRS